jgi:hypothetical protein
MLQEYAQEANHPVAYGLALLDAHDPNHTSHNLGVELFLVKFFLCFALALLPAFFACLWWLETTCLLYLPKVDY